MSRPSSFARPKSWAQKTHTRNASTGQIYSESNTFGYSSDKGVSDLWYHTIGQTKTPGYKGKRKRRVLPDTSYTHNVVRVLSESPFYNDVIDKTSGFGYRTEVSNTAKYYPQSPLDYGIGESAFLQASNKGVMRLGNKASGLRVNYAQFLGERKQVANMLASTATRIVTAARALKRADLRTFTRALSLSGTETASSKKMWRRVEDCPLDKRLSSFWLEYVYGWRPLLSDVFGTAELLAERVVSDQGPHGILRASGKGSEIYHDMLKPNLPRLDISLETRVRYVARYRLESVGRQLLAQTGISNPMLLAWELLPYSFVVDWFVPVGTYLESLTAFDGFELVSGTVSRTDKVNALASFKRFEDKPTYKQDTTGHVTKNQVRYSRSTMSSWPSYVLTVKNPLGGNPLERFTTAFSLMRVLFADPPRKR